MVIIIPNVQAGVEISLYPIQTKTESWLFLAGMFLTIYTKPRGWKCFHPMLKPFPTIGFAKLLYDPVFGYKA